MWFELEAAQALAREASARHDAEAQARQEAEQRASEQATTARRLRRQAFLLLGALVLALLTMLVTLKLWNKAQQQTATAFAKQLAFRAEQVKNQNAALLERSTLLAVGSMRRFPSLEADQPLRYGLALLRRSTARLTHEGAVYQVVFSPDGKVLATASEDKTARVSLWRSEDMIAAACTRLSRNLTQEEWKQYLGEEPYQKTCVDLPIHSSVLDEGRNLAKAGKQQEAIAYFQAVKKLEPSLTLDPETETRHFAALGLVEKGKSLASDGKLPEAIAAFREAKSFDPSLPFDPESEARKLAAPGMIEKGKKLAREGQMPEAIAAFREACSLDPSLTLNPESEARKLAAPGLVDKGKTFAKEGKVQEALAAYAQAQQLDPTVKISARDWNTLCWFGSVEGHAAAVMDVCQKAVALDPKTGSFRDSRGVARALTGDVQGAVADFKLFTKWTKKERLFEERRPQREKWIADLQAGKKPFDADTLKALREQ